jgi:hypothetical protein
MRFLIDDLKRRKPLLVGVIYSLGSVVVLALSLVVFTATQAPEWALNLLVATLLMPFPFVVILTWALTAEPPEDVKAAARRKRRDVVGGPPIEG